jgi:Gpi18-like mannosyltransferase
LTVGKYLRLKPNRKFLLAALFFLFVFCTVNYLNHVFGISVDPNPVKLRIDRSDSYFILDISSQNHESLWFTWDVTVDEVYSGQEATLQSSSDGQFWSNLKTITLKNDGAESNQPIDSTWAVSGKNFLRVVVGNEISNTVELTVHVGVWSWIVPAFAGLFAITIGLICIKRKINFKNLKLFKGRKERIVLIVIGLLILLVLAPWTEQRFDNYVQRLWGSTVYQYSFLPFYPTMPVDYPSALRYSYPPVLLYIILTLFPIWLSTSGFVFPPNPSSLWIHGLAVNNIFESYRSFVPQTLPTLDLLLKLPNIIASIGIALVLSKFFADSKRKNAILILWLFNPFIIYISAVWGLADALCAFLATLSVYLLLKKRNLLSSLLLALSIATKLYPIFFAIPILIYLHKNQGKITFFKYLLSSLIFGALIFGSFFIFPGGSKLVSDLFLFRTSPDMMGENLFGGMTWMNILSFLSWEGNLPIFPLIFIPAYFGINYLFWKRKNTFDSLIICLTCTILLAYLSYTVINPQYILWVLPFLLYLTFKGKYPRKLLIVFSLLPLIFIFSVFNPLYMLSPAVVLNENNYPPLSDIIQQLWPAIFNETTIAVIILLFTLVAISSLAILISPSFSEFSSRLWEREYTKLMMGCQRLKNRISSVRAK